MTGTDGMNQAGAVTRSFLRKLRMSPEELGLDPGREYPAEDGVYRCRRCGAVTVRRIAIPGTGGCGWWRFRCSCPTDEERAAEEAARAEAARSAEAMISRRRAASGVPAKFADATLRSIRTYGRGPSFIEAFHGFCSMAESPELYLPSGEGIYVWGGCGVGKTLLASAFCNDVIDRGYSALFLSYDDIFTVISGTWRHEGGLTASDFFGRIRDADFMVIDDFGQTRIRSGSGLENWKRDELFHVINTRYGARKPTVFTANADPERLPELGFSEQIASRIREMSALVYPIIDRNQRQLPEDGSEEDRNGIH